MISLIWNLRKKKMKRTKTTNSQEKRSDLWLPEVGGVGKGNWRKAVKRDKLPAVKQMTTKDATYNMMTRANTADDT